MFENCKLVDLTHFLDGDIPTWNGSCGFSHEVKMNYNQGVCVMSYKSHAGVGTHMDAPNHFYEGANAIGDISINQFFVKVYIIDVREKVHPDFFLCKDDVIAFEKKYGKIEKNSLVVAFTGWSKFWETPEKYRNMQDDKQMHFPGFSEKSVAYLLSKEIVGIGIDTLSPDGSNMNFPVHKLLLGQGKYIIENLTNLDEMPPCGAYIVALPPKVRLGSESAIRAVGLIVEK